MMTFISMALHFKPMQFIQHKILANQAKSVHGTFLNKITAYNRALGEELHTEHQQHNMSLSIPRSDRHSATVRVSFFGKNSLSYLEALMNQLLNSGTVKIDNVPYRVSLDPQQNQIWQKVSTWTDLTAPSNQRIIQVHFATPMSINHERKNGRQVASILPIPQLVFRSLYRRWQSLDGPELPKDFLEWLDDYGCVISRHHIQSVCFYDGPRTQKGFVGPVTYTCLDGDSPYSNVIVNLIRLGFFTGVGYQTTRGMGCIRPLERHDYA